MAEVKEVPSKEEEVTIDDGAKGDPIGSIDAKDDTSNDAMKCPTSPAKSDEKAADEGNESPEKNAMQTTEKSPSKGETEIEEKMDDIVDKEVPKEEEEASVKGESTDCPEEEIKEDSIDSFEAKNETDSSMISPSKSPVESPEKSANEEKISSEKITEQSPKKDETEGEEDIGKDEGNEEEEDEEEEEGEKREKKKGTLDLPLLIDGERKRKSTSFFKVAEVVHPKHKAQVVGGSGTALRDIPFVVRQINAEKRTIDLRPLYNICYGKQGKLHTLKKELRNFNGFSFAVNSEAYKKKLAVVHKLTRNDLAHIRRILGVTSGKTKDDEIQIIMDFLLNPHDEGKKVPEKRKSSGRTPKKPAQKRAADDQSAKTPSKKMKKADSEDEGEEKDNDVSSDSSEEKNELTPSDKEVKAKIAELIKTFDLSDVTMKQMVVAVCDAFPAHPQLNERAATIKEFIKEAIKDED